MEGMQTGNDVETALLKIQGDVETNLPKETVETDTTPVQKTEEVKEQPVKATEEVVVEKTTDKQQKIGDLIDLKRKARALSKELSGVPEEPEAVVEPIAPVVQKMTAEEREELLAEAEARAEAKLKPQLEETARLKEENDNFKNEQAIVKLKGIISKDVKSFVKEHPHAELMIDQEYLTNLVISNEKNAQFTVEELILKAYPNVKQAPKMDAYGGEAKNSPQPTDFSNMTEDDLTRMEKNPKMSEEYARYVAKYLNK